MDVFSTVSVVIPAINETDSLKKGVDMILRLCAPVDLEEIFIVVCERTTPECLRVIAELKNQPQEVPIKLYKQKEPGLGRALCESLGQVTGSHVTYMSADLDTDPHVLATMIKTAKRHPDAIILGSRWIEGGGFIGYGRINKMLNYIFNRMLQLLFFTKVTDLTYGYRFAPMDKTLSIKWESKGFSIGTETNLKMVRLGYKFIEVPAVWQVRKEGESQNSFFTKLKYIKTVLKVRFARLSTLKNPNYIGKPNE